MPLGTLRRRVKKAPLPKLQITAMMDMFTIIMIFLLVSFSARPERMSLDRDLELPRSAARQDYTRNVRVVLSRSVLKVEDEVVATVEDGALRGLDPARPERSELFRRLRERRQESDAAAGDGPPDPHVLFFCDRSHPFKTVNAVMKAAGLAGYPNLQFAVLEQ